MTIRIVNVDRRAGVITASANELPVPEVRSRLEVVRVFPNTPEIDVLFAVQAVVSTDDGMLYVQADYFRAYWDLRHASAPRDLIVQILSIKDYDERQAQIERARAMAALEAGP